MASLAVLLRRAQVALVPVLFAALANGCVQPVASGLPYPAVLKVAKPSQTPAKLTNSRVFVPLGASR